MAIGTVLSWQSKLEEPVSYAVSYRKSEGAGIVLKQLGFFLVNMYTTAYDTGFDWSDELVSIHDGRR